MISTKRWNDPRDTSDGFRLLVTRYRPRGVPKAKETWDDWWPQLGPSRALHAAVYGKSSAPISFDEYARRYLDEVAHETFRLRALADRATDGESITLLCSSACVDPTRCHRTILARLIMR